MPSVPAASAAVSGGIGPAFCWPSVRRTTNLLFAVDARSRFTAVARPEPIAVPSSIIPTLARSRFCRSQPWSSVSGHCVYGRAANSTSPTRSSGRAVTNSLTTALTASSRLARPEASVKSSDSMLPETSTASTTSTPSRCTLVAAMPGCEPAVARGRDQELLGRHLRRTQLEATLEIAADDVGQLRVVFLERALLDETAGTEPVELGGGDDVGRPRRGGGSGALRT